jgi:hypothetical protein
MLNEIQGTVFIKDGVSELFNLEKGLLNINLMLPKYMCITKMKLR